MTEVLFAAAVVGSALALILLLAAFLYAAELRGRVLAIEHRLARLERWMQGGAPAPDGTDGRPDRVPETAAPAPTPPPAGDPAAPKPTPTPAFDPATPPPPASDPATPAFDPATPQPAAPASPEPSSAPLLLETRIGARWMLYAGVAILVIGVGLFIRYAFVNQWVNEPLRVGTGAVAGGLLVLSGRRFAARGHARFGATMVGGGVAAWYLAAFAAQNLYHLVGPAAGFTLFTAVTGFAAFQADRLRALPLGMMAIVGGFSAPFLVGSGADAQAALFTYFALLLGAVVYLAHRRDWPALNLASFLLTGLTVLVWYSRSYQPGAYLLTEAFFTLYAGLFLWVRHRSRASTGPYARATRWALATTPFWYHAASLAVLGDHGLAFLVYLIAFTGVGVAAAARRGATWARAALWTAVAGPLAAWGVGGVGASWVVSASVAWMAIAGLHTAAQIELLRRRGGPLHAADVVLAPLNAFSLAFGLHALLAPHVPALTVLVIALLAAAWWVVAAAVRRIDPRASMHWLTLAAAFAVAAIGLRFGGAWGALACAAEAAGLAWVGIHERRPWIRAMSAGLLATAALAALAVQTADVPVVHTAILNRRALLGLFVAGAAAFVAWLHRREAAQGVPWREPAVAAAAVAANVLLLFTLSMEIHAFWELRRGVERFAANAQFAGQMMMSATWAAYAAALTAAGIRRQYAPIRYLALVIFGTAVLKVFIVDFSQLDAVYRIASSVVLGVLLLAASYLYQRQ